MIGVRVERAFPVGSCLLLLGLLFLAPTGSAAQGGSGSEGRGFPGAHASGAASIFGGRYAPENEVRLPDLEAGAVWGLGGTLYPDGSFPLGSIGVDFHAWSVTRTFRSVVEGAASERTAVDTEAFAVGARAGLPTAWPVGAWVLGGLTYASHTMKVEALPAWFFPEWGQTWEAEDGGWAPYWGLAVEARVGNLGVGLERRWISAEATFEEPFAMADVGLGGTATALYMTVHLGR